jgi:murein L,D-transpeptidase YcbB/YkuD
MQIRQPIFPGTPHEAVRRVREKYSIYPVSQDWDERVIQRIRGQQVLLGLHPDGVLDQETIDKMGI